MLERINATMKYYRNDQITDGRPNLTAWFQGMRACEPARNISSDDLSHALAIPPQIGPVDFMRERSKVSLDVDTRRAKHMLNDGPEGQFARSEAAKALCRNFDAVVKDACKGTRVDPGFADRVALAARAIANVLVDPDTLESTEENIRRELQGSGVILVVAAVQFMRSRCCSPRDMSIDAQVQFCGAINWLVRCLGEEP